MNLLVSPLGGYILTWGVLCSGLESVKGLGLARIENAFTVATGKIRNIDGGMY